MLFRSEWFSFGILFVKEPQESFNYVAASLDGRLSQPQMDFNSMSTDAGVQKFQSNSSYKMVLVVVIWSIFC